MDAKWTVSEESGKVVVGAVCGFCAAELSVDFAVLESASVLCGQQVRRGSPLISKICLPSSAVRGFASAGDESSDEFEETFVRPGN